MERQRGDVLGVRKPQGRQMQQLIIGACLLGLLVAGETPSSRAAEPVSAPKPAGEPTPQPNQERFLQNFISQSLGQGPAATAAPSPSPQSAVVSPQSSAPSPQPAPPTGDLTAATMKMVLALAGILALLVLGGYVIRRYLLDQTFLGKRTPLMRVLARVNITPKVGVALLEVPGKVLVVGITGSTLVALGEIAPIAPAPTEHAAETRPSTFATTLDHSTSRLTAEEKPSDVLLKISEAIQQKVSQLKQL